MCGDLCYACDGTGERDWLSGAPCLDCNGTGWREEPDDEDRPMYEECVYCDGLGRDDQGNDCQHCDGNGYV